MDDWVGVVVSEDDCILLLLRDRGAVGAIGEGVSGLLGIDGAIGEVGELSEGGYLDGREAKFCLLLVGGVGGESVSRAGVLEVLGVTLGDFFGDWGEGGGYDGDNLEGIGLRGLEGFCEDDAVVGGWTVS